MTRAFVMVRVETGEINDVQMALAAIPGVQEVNIVTGDYDMVLVVEEPTTTDLGRLVMRDIRGVPGVTTTTTYVVVG